MNYSQLVLNVQILKQIKEGEKPLVNETEKVDLDYLADYFNNLILNIDRDRHKSHEPVIYYRICVEVNK